MPIKNSANLLYFMTINQTMALSIENQIWFFSRIAWGHNSADNNEFLAFWKHTRSTC